MKDVLSDILCIFPEALKSPVENALKIYPDAMEVRFIADESVYLYTQAGIRFICKDNGVSFKPCDNMLVPTYSQIEEITDRATGFSGFVYEKELKDGFISFGEGFRIGICSVRSGDGFSYGKIRSVSVRLPYTAEYSYPLLTDDVLADIRNGILIAGAPSSGKTTLLRYLAKRLSDGIRGEIKKVCVIDERNELFLNEGLGATTDVIGGMSKEKAILHAVRLMSPHYIICDEIGGVEEVKSLLEGLNCGVKFVATIHAGDIRSLVCRKQFRLLFRENAIERVLFLSSCKIGKIAKIYDYGEIKNEILGNYGNMYFD